ncbi:MAG: hypothetical protein ACLPYS_02660 [Vulcanimicrobiaceae bacterium]
MARKNGVTHAPASDPLANLREQYAQIRHAADSAVRFEIERVRERHPYASEPELQRIVASACRPYRAKESAALQQLVAKLDECARELLFKETLDTHFMPRQVAERVPAELAGVL